MLTEKIFDTGEVVINYAESDTNGPPMVMLPGVTLNWQTLAGSFTTAMLRYSNPMSHMPRWSKLGKRGTTFAGGPLAQ